jgi:hypothetical protein
MDALAEPEQDDRRDYEPELKAASDKFDRWLPRVVEAVIRALFATGEPDKNDPLIVAHTLERVQADERLMRFVARLVEERSRGGDRASRHSADGRPRARARGAGRAACGVRPRMTQAPVHGLSAELQACAKLTDRHTGRGFDSRRLDHRSHGLRVAEPPDEPASVSCSSPRLRRG